MFNLFAALTIATIERNATITERKRRCKFLEFMDRIVADYFDTQEIHVIMDNYRIHKKCDEWLASIKISLFTIHPLLRVVLIWWKIGLAF
ncbi:MAG: transposase [Deltaproteobacteria bacterium]|nr:transposase [Deltaproteobacteria bacterium]